MSQAQAGMSRIYVVGPDSDGRGRVESVEDASPANTAQATTRILSGWPVGAASGLPDVRGRSPVLILGLAPGEVQWQLISLPVHNTGGLHRTDTIDFDTIVSGNPILDLGDEKLQLHPGDCVFLKAVDHAWHTTELPASFYAVLVGLEPDKCEGRVEHHLRAVGGVYYRANS
jgi:mannose-6-phosphate isomerase-like protein (cupin superfamily)